MTIMHTSRPTLTPGLSIIIAYILNRSYVHHCVTGGRQQYPITPLFWGDLVHVQTMCTRLFLHDPQNVDGGEPRNEARGRG